MIRVRCPVARRTLLAWGPSEEGPTCAEVVTEVVPRRLIRVTSWAWSEVTVTVTVRPGRYQSRLCTRIPPRPRMPVILPLSHCSGSAGSSSSTPGLVQSSASASTAGSACAASAL